MHAQQDPVCKVSLQSIEKSQGSRLCTIVLMSAGFRSRVKDIRQSYPIVCNRNLISFRTAEAINVAAEESYYELMVTCNVRMIDNNEDFFFISRAYNANQVFVYSLQNPERKLYLENLSTNVSIIHDYYNFGTVEI